MIRVKSNGALDSSGMPLRVARDEDVAQAIQRVLEAESDARSRVASCRQRADSILEAARVRAHAIARRADARISRLHGKYLRRIDERLAELTRGDAVARTGDVSTDEKALAAAVTKVAAEMTS